MRDLEAEYRALEPGGMIVYHVGFLALDFPECSKPSARQAWELAHIDREPLGKSRNAHLVQRRLADRLWEYQIRKSHNEKN